MPILDLCDAALVEVQEATETLAASDRRVLVGWRLARGGGRDQAVPEALMVPLRVIVLHELSHRRAKMPLAERDQFVQALRPDGQYKPLGEGIQVRGLCPGSLMGLTPASRRMRRNSSVKSGSRSWMT